MKGFILMLVVLFGINLLTVGCAKQQQHQTYERTQTSAPEYFFHTVKYRGETLGLIARWYTGNTANWQAIIKDNPGMRPERINLGDVIRIPNRLVTERNPLPERFVSGSRGASQAAPAASKPQEVKSNSAVSQGKTEATSKDATFDEFDDFGLDSEVSQPTTKIAEPVEMQAEEVIVEKPAPSPAANVDAEELERERLLEELLGE